MTEKHAFQAEVNQVLSLVVNSLYTHREVFLRELLSNASDALDHLSFRALTEPDVMGAETDLEIRIVPDEDARTLTISDNGVGMTHDEMVEHLGTIAHSGTRKLAETIAKDGSADVSLIGQFGVGFYSAFLVAERVEVLSRAAGSDDAWRWESDAQSGFTVAQASRDGRGTDVILHLRKESDEDAGDFLRDWTLRELVRKYSDYVRHPIKLRVERKEDDETTVEWEQVNTAAALWTRPRSEIEDEQYDDFYKHFTHDWEPPLARSHFKVEGMQEFTGLLFLPRRAPPDLFARERKGVRLFVKRVFIMDDCEELLPEYLRFVRGVVDSEDLPLNVSREFLQKDRTTTAIKKQVVRHVLKLLEELADEEPQEREGDDSDDAGPEKRYDVFWSQFGRILKEGVHFDTGNRERLAKLLRYESSADEGLTSLAAYAERMQEGQESIYFVTADSRSAAESSPHIEALRSRGFEVLYMTDPVDEWVVEGLREFEEKKLVSAAKGALDLPESDDEKEEREKQQGEFEELTTRMQEVLDERVKAVRLTSRLTDSPACLVVDEDGISPHVERMLRAQQADVPAQKRILELNAAHPVVARLGTLHEAGEGERVADWTRLLFDQALISEGSPPSDPAGFARRVSALMAEAATHE